MRAKKRQQHPSLAFGICMLVGAGLALWLILAPHHVRSVSERAEEPATLPGLVASMKRGDYARAAAIAKEIQNNPVASDEDAALAAYHAVGARFRLSGDDTDLRADVRDLKQGLSLDIAPEIRARLLAGLAGMYFLNGTVRPVSDEIFKDAPYSDYWRGTTFNSVRGMFEESMRISPNAYAEIGIAHWYAKVSQYDKMLTPTEREAHQKLARKHLAAAEALYMKERAVAGPDMAAEHIRYRAMHAGTYGLLVIQGLDPYSRTYPALFEDFLRDAEKGEDALMRELQPYVRFRFAHALEHEGDLAAAEAQLDLLAREIRALENPDTHMFVLLVRNEKKYAPNGAVWTTVQERMKISPAFKAAIEAVL